MPKRKRDGEILVFSNSAAESVTGDPAAVIKKQMSMLRDHLNLSSDFLLRAPTHDYMENLKMSILLMQAICKISEECKSQEQQSRYQEYLHALEYVQENSDSYLRDIDSAEVKRKIGSEEQTELEGAINKLKSFVVELEDMVPDLSEDQSILDKSPAAKVAILENLLHESLNAVMAALPQIEAAVEKKSFKL